MKVLFLARHATAAPPRPPAAWAELNSYEARVVAPLAGRPPAPPLLKLAVPTVRGEQVAAVYASRRRGQLLYQIAAPRRGRAGPPLTTDEQAICFSLAAVALCRALAWTPDVLHVLDPAFGAAIYWLATDGLRDDALGAVAAVLSLWAVPAAWAGAGRALRAYGLAPSDAPHLPDDARDALPALAIAHADGLLLEGALAFPDAPARALPIAPRAAVQPRPPRLDLAAWDPARDPALARRYDAQHLARRAANKRALQQALKLNPTSGLLTVVLARGETSASLALEISALRRWLAADQTAQAAFIGPAAPDIAAELKALAQALPGRLAVQPRDPATLVRRAYAGADVYLGLAAGAGRGLPVQRALRYGAVPLVAAWPASGDGLVDARRPRGGNSFIVKDYNSSAILSALRRARRASRRAARWQALLQHGLQAAEQVAAEPAAQPYLALYHLAIGARKEKRDQLAGSLAELPAAT
ncbi:MAG: hypothetical protein IT317_17920 [Anaerolineales bacterium]|nr:hypothetical protein [Anaerolineales bacterium]